MANDSFKVKRSLNIEPIAGAAPTAEGDVVYDVTAHKAKLHNGTSDSPLVTEDHTATLTNKTVSGDDNTITDIDLTSAVTGILPKANGGSGQDNSSITFPSSGTLATLAGAESFSNKTFSNAQTLTQISTPSSPSAGSNKLYVKSDDSLYLLNSSGVEQQVGSGAGGGGAGLKNYLGSVNGTNGNGNFELGSTSKWSLAHSTLDSTTKLPNQISSSWTSASGNLSLNVSSSGISKLAGSYSAVYASSAATTAGDMLVSDNFTIDRADLGKVLQFKFYYNVTVSPSNGNFSGTSSNSFGVAIYNAVNGTWIQPAGTFNIVQSSGAGIATGTFQTSVNSEVYRFALYNVNATSGAITLAVDDFFVGPQITVAGAAMSDWQSYTPTLTGFGTASNVQYQWRRVGDSVQIQGKFTSGTSTATEARVSLPSGLTAADTTKIPSIMEGGIGVINQNLAGVVAILAEPSVTYHTFGAQTGARNGLTKVNADDFLASGQAVSYLATIPIQGWSSNTVMSNDTDTRAVVAIYQSTATTAQTGTPIIDYATKILDTHGAVTTGASWKFKAPVPGNYRITTQGETGTTAATIGNYGSLRLYKNGSADIYLAIVTAATTSAMTKNMTGSYIIPLIADETIDVRFEANFSSTHSLSGNTNSNWITVERLSGPATIAASEKIRLEYTGNGGTSITADTTNIDFTTKVVDSHGAWSGTTFTAPRPDFYLYSLNVLLSASSGAVIYLYKNGRLRNGNGVSTDSKPLTGGIYLLAGETISFRSDSSVTLSNSATYHYLTIWSQ